MTHDLGPVSQFPASGRLLVQGAKHPVAVFRLNDSFYAVEELCPHRGGPLSEGAVEEGCVTCPWHGARFEIKTGRKISGPVNRDLKTYAVIVENGQLKLEED